MAKPTFTQDQALDQVVGMARKGFLIQPQSAYHYRIPFTAQVYVDWWPTTCKIRIVTPDDLSLFTLTDMLPRQVEPILRGLHYAVFGREPRPVVHTRQSEPDRVKPEEQRNRARRAVSEGGPRSPDVCDESSPPWD